MTGEGDVKSYISQMFPTGEGNPSTQRGIQTRDHLRRVEYRDGKQGRKSQERAIHRGLSGVLRENAEIRHTALADVRAFSLPI